MGTAPLTGHQTRDSGLSAGAFHSGAASARRDGPAPPRPADKEAYMGQTIRFGVSLDSELLEKFDALCAKRGNPSRSEAIRDLIRQELIREEWENETQSSAATLTLVFDHHRSDLAQKLTELQHESHESIIASMHVHLDHDNCLEVLVLMGPAAKLRALADKLTAVKGVKHGELSLATTGSGLA